MVSEAKGRFFKRKNGKYLIYLPLRLAENSMFSFKGPDSIISKSEFQTWRRRETNRRKMERG